MVTDRIIVQNFYLSSWYELIWTYWSFNKDTLILGEEPTQGLDDATLAAEAKCCINFTQSRKRFVLSLHYNGRKSFLLVNATKMYQFKAKESEINDYALCLGNISKDFIINNMKKTGLKGIVIFFLLILI